MRYFNIFTRKSFVDDQGESKFTWYKVGYMKTTPNGGRFITMFNQPDTAYYVLDPEEQSLPEIQLEN
jgi:hypothetical protein